MTNHARQLALVTGAASGIGYELARCCALHGFDLVVAADNPDTHRAAGSFRQLGINADALHVDLGTSEGVDLLLAQTDGQPIEVLIANAGLGLTRPFMVQSFTDIQRVIETNVTGTLRLIQRVARPGPQNAVYNGTKAFIDSFSHTLREELHQDGITVTYLKPTPAMAGFAWQAEVGDAAVARACFKALMEGEAEIVIGLAGEVS
ncbi:SDR family NAD(P)-dependent oxidoreductase [Niveispirillum sp. KHB5.9]|uniref:SDR family NAD(P)-dependent oxidoreductase n=1 Tax=Niveispirillum sp. KHB5.9 TaxID=3400269 RepID=UPI003A88747A